MALGIWTDYRIAELRKLYDKGLSCSMIACEMGAGLSRNAIIGKVHRLKLEVRGQGKHQRSEVGSRSAPRGAARATPFRPSHAVIEEAKRAKLRCVEIIPLHLSLMDLERDDCRWCYGDSPFTFCGHPKMEGGAYCAPHFYLSIGPGTPSERSAQKISAVHLEPFA